MDNKNNQDGNSRPEAYKDIWEAAELEDSESTAINNATNNEQPSLQDSPTPQGENIDSGYSQTENYKTSQTLIPAQESLSTPTIKPGPQIVNLQQAQPTFSQDPQQPISNYENINQPENVLPKKRNSKIKIVFIVAIVIFILAGSLAVYAVVNSNKDSSAKNPASGSPTLAPTTKTSGADAAIDGFIEAIIKKDKSKADALQTKAMQETVKAQMGTTSLYDSCQTEDNFCDQLFSKEYLNSGTVKTIDYTAKDGTKGKQRVYTVTTKDSQTNSTLSGTSKSTTTITFAAIELDNNWMIDNFNFESNFSADASTR
jgi:hypothetical protein